MSGTKKELTEKYKKINKICREIIKQHYFLETREHRKGRRGEEIKSNVQIMKAAR